MKQGLVAAVAMSILFNASAIAADKASVPAPLFNWSGFYVGANAGWMSYNANGPLSILGEHFNAGDKDTGIGGFHGGYQLQAGNFVYGIEGAWTKNLSGEFASTPGAGLLTAACSASLGDNCEARLKEVWQIGPRLGYSFGTWMAYVTGGYAYGSIEARSALPDATKGHNGWFLGGGAETAITDHLVLGLEYKHYDFLAANYYFSGVPTHYSIHSDADAVTFRVTFK